MQRRTVFLVLLGLTTVPFGGAEASSDTYCFGRRATYVGSPVDDRVQLTEAIDVVVTGGGNDLVSGDGDSGGGPDYVCLGPGDDSYQGTDDDDHVDAGSGDDRISAGLGGADLLYGGAGNDTIEGWEGADVIFGQGGHDTLFGGGGGDHLVGGDGADLLWGDYGYGRSDEEGYAGGPGDDLLEGGDGDDHLDGEGHAARVDGSDGDSCDGGSGIDTLRHCRSSALGATQSWG